MLNSDLDLSGRPLTGSPADQRRFVDRKEEFDRTWQSLSLRANVLLVGDRGSGKTSFLRKLEATINASDELGEATYVDGSSVDTLERLIGAVQRGLVSRGLELEQRETAVDVLAGLRPLAVQSLFPPTVLLDQPLPDIAHTLFGRLRDEVWQLPYTWVVSVDTVDQPRVARAPADAFFGATVVLGALSDRSALALLHHYIDKRLDADALETLVDLADGSPRRLISLARTALVEGVPVSELLKQHLHQEELLAQASPPAQELARYLADAGPRSASDADLLSHFGWTRNRAVQVFNELARLGIATGRVEKGGRRKLYSLA